MSNEATALRSGQASAVRSRQRSRPRRRIETVQATTSIASKVLVRKHEKKLHISNLERLPKSILQECMKWLTIQEIAQGPLRVIALDHLRLPKVVLLGHHARAWKTYQASWTQNINSWRGHVERLDTYEAAWFVELLASGPGRLMAVPSNQVVFPRLESLSLSFTWNSEGMTPSTFRVLMEQCPKLVKLVCSSGVHLNDESDWTPAFGRPWRVFQCHEAYVRPSVYIQLAGPQTRELEFSITNLGGFLRIHHWTLRDVEQLCTKIDAKTITSLQFVGCLAKDINLDSVVSLLVRHCPNLRARPWLSSSTWLGGHVAPISSSTLLAMYATWSFMTMLPPPSFERFVKTDDKTVVTCTKTPLSYIDTNSYAVAYRGEAKNFFASWTWSDLHHILTSSSEWRIVNVNRAFEGGMADEKLVLRFAQTCPRLERLYLRPCDRISVVGLEQLLKKCPHLHILHLGDPNQAHVPVASDLTSTALAKIKNYFKQSLPAVDLRIDFGVCSLTASDVASVAEWSACPFYAALALKVTDEFARAWLAQSDEKLQWTTLRALDGGAGGYSDGRRYLPLTASVYRLENTWVAHCVPTAADCVPTA